MQSYIRDLQRYRPHIRIQTFIDYFKKNNLWEYRIKGNRDQLEEKYKAIFEKYDAVIRDWFKLSLWYVRLK